MPHSHDVYKSDYHDVGLRSDMEASFKRRTRELWVLKAKEESTWTTQAHAHTYMWVVNGRAAHWNATQET